MKIRDLVKYGTLIDDVVDTWQDADDTLRAMEIGQQAVLNADSPIRAKSRSGKTFRLYLLAERDD